YLVAREKTFVFLITKQALYYTEIPLGRKGYKITGNGNPARTRSLKQLIQSVSPCLFDADPSQCASVDAISANIQLWALHDLYETILHPIADRLRPRSPLTIVPDDALYYLPFEMLVSGFESRTAPRYLLSQYPIPYSYSAGILLELP